MYHIKATGRVILQLTGPLYLGCSDLPSFRNKVLGILFLRHRVCKFHPKPIQHIPIFQTGKLSFSTKYLMEFVIKYYLIYADRTPV